MPTHASIGHSREVYLNDALPAGTNAIGKLAENDGVDIGDVDVASIAAGDNNIGNVDIASITAGETHIGQVGTGGNIVDVTPVCDTSAYTAADVLFDSTEVANAVRVSGGRSELVSVSLLDEDDQTAAAIDLYFLRSNVSLGTINNAVSITDANAREILGYVAIGSGDFKDLINSKLACIKNINLLVEPTTGTSIWVAATCAGTPTQTASGIKLRLGFRYY